MSELQESCISFWLKIKNVSSEQQWILYNSLHLLIIFMAFKIQNSEKNDSQGFLQTCYIPFGKDFDAEQNWVIDFEFKSRNNDKMFSIPSTRHPAL